MVDKDLFLHDLAIVSILKNEGPYLKEWLDYHLAAGVDHFYLYDNESPDNQAEVAKPYVEAGLADYFSAPGKGMQCAVYNDAVKNFKFLNRYMAFVDGDEFIYTRAERGGALAITDVVDEILSHDPNAAGLAINWQLFGSNGEETADFSRGVLERFTRRAPKDYAPDGTGNAHVKTVANPRKVGYISIPHFAFYFEGTYAVNENGGVVGGAFNNPVTIEKIVMNHYNTKSREEYAKKVSRGGADYTTYNMENFDKIVTDMNAEFDDDILKYRDERAKVYQPPDNSHADERLFNALTRNLSPTLIPTTPQSFYIGKMETFLTCRAVASYLKTKLINATPAIFFEEAALVAILRSIGGMSFADARLFIRELPNLLGLPYPVVKELHNAAVQLILQMKDVMRINSMWKDFVELDHLMNTLKLGG